MELSLIVVDLVAVCLVVVDLMVAIVVVVAVVVVSGLVVVVVVVVAMVIDDSFVAVVEPISPVASIPACPLCIVLVMPPSYLIPPVGVAVLAFLLAPFLPVAVCVGCRGVVMHISLILVATMVVMMVVVMPMPSHSVMIPTVVPLHTVPCVAEEVA